MGEWTGGPVLFSLRSYVTVKLLVIFKAHAVHSPFTPANKQTALLRGGKTVLPFVVALSTSAGGLDPKLDLALRELSGANRAVPPPPACRRAVTFGSIRASCLH